MLLNRPVLLAILSAIALLLVLLGVSRVALHSARLETETVRRDFAQYRAQAEQKAREASEQAREREHALQVRNDALGAEYEAQKVSLQAVGARLAATDGKLREYATRLAAAGHAGCQDSGTGARIDATSAETSRLPNMVGMLDQFAAEASRAADACAVTLTGLQEYVRSIVSEGKFD
jgi:hypothetical protein